MTQFAGDRPRRASCALGTSSGALIPDTAFVGILAFSIVFGTGCGTPNPRIIDATDEAAPKPIRETEGATEVDKIRMLITAVRQSKHVFIQDGNERNGAAAAADLERRLARVPAGIPTARQFVDRVGAGRLRATEPDQVRVDDGTSVPLRDWLLTRLGEIERTTARAKTRREINQGKTGGNEDSATNPVLKSELGILDALTIVERSRLRFVAPARRTPKGKIKGKRKEYSSTEFAEMLRKKWEFLGADIHDLDGFIDEIATDAFASMEPYRVIHKDSSEQAFRTWLVAQLDARRQALAKGGAP